LEILTEFWWIAVVLVVALVVVLTRRSHVRKCKAAQYRADESTIINIYNDFRSDDIRIYEDLPNRASRVDWLKRHYPEFMEAAERHFRYNSRIDVEGMIAVHLDSRLLRGIHAYNSPDDVLRTYQSVTSHKSLNDYQVEVDEFNAERAKWEEARAKAEAKHHAEQRALRVKEEAAETIRRNAAKTYWKSLSKSEKEAFKEAKGKNARKRALPSTASTGYSLDTLYPLIMATQFSNIATDANNSIDYCQSPSYGHSSSHSYTDSGSHHSSHDSGSSYSSSDSGSSSSSDGGGGGGGGGGD
jgi:uncharacterized membrane protein YgcG